eukprot:CAMPEP_0171237634 /NCGR_PEP_ID=MMETSP0790-20130122/43065_1 /TAXON_ID=2925 /ORGANISM="Alexandrium catenella, Strain OF101" /LENGTH=367 /DNA_ID=CAMNT_0011703987 /DNA_START=54 /DNA_END=1155 /DNA_ORIENTATION=-
MTSGLAEPFLEFGFCGIDHSIPPEVLREVFAPLEPPAADRARLVAAFQLAYQGYPGNPTPEYAKDAPLDQRRYGGLVYPSWSEIDDYVENKLPSGTLLSFHLNETPKCPYVSGLLRGDPQVLDLVRVLVDKYSARHIQVNLTSFGVGLELFSGKDEALAQASAKVLRDLCAKHPSAIFVVPIARVERDGASVDTLAFFERLLAAPAPGNLCGFYDSSAGTGKEPDAAPELPDCYPKQRVGFTGGIRPDNAKTWLDRYAARAQQHGCTLLCDAQSGFRQNGKRGEPVNVPALQELARAVREWAAGAPKGQASAAPAEQAGSAADSAFVARRGAAEELHDERAFEVHDRRECPIGAGAGIERETQRLSD